MFEVGFLPTLPSLLVGPSVPLIHRDLSWLQFNERVLGEANAQANPPLERAKFIAITASNLDEFFMIRFASLLRTTSPVSERVQSTLLESAAKFVVKQQEAFDAVVAELDAHGVKIVKQVSQESPSVQALAKQLFGEQVLAKLGTPEEFAPPRLHQLDNLQMAAIFATRSIWFKVPRGTPLVLHGIDAETQAQCFFFIDDLLGALLGSALGYPENPGLVRITRDGDFTLDLEDEDPESVPDVVRKGLGNRERGRPVRLQYSGEIPSALLHQALKVLKLLPEQVMVAGDTFCLAGLWTVVHNAKASDGKIVLGLPPLEPKMPAELADRAQIFERVRAGDILIHYPYDSFETYTNWLLAACEDPKVKRIEQTLYRMDALSPILSALKDAAKTKEVGVFIELRARFDEANNLAIAEDLRTSGVKVRFGFGKLKLHAKVALVTREETGPAGVFEARYTHLSTGNYKASTARQYTDLSILTANADVGSDARHFFDSVSEERVPTSFRTLVSAPTRLHRRLTQLIEQETAAAARGEKTAKIVFKVNALVDSGVINHLYAASRAGVQVDLIVRGACSLIPGVKGLSDNIRVVSVVDRFLEHSRLYFFGASRQLYLSSADCMPRNFFSRLELAFPIRDPRIFDYIEHILIPAYLADTIKARELTPQGTWKKRAFPSARHRFPPAVEKQVGRKGLRSQALFETLSMDYCIQLGVSAAPKS